DMSSPLSVMARSAGAAGRRPARRAIQADHEQFAGTIAARAARKNKGLSGRRDHRASSLIRYWQSLKRGNWRAGSFAARFGNAALFLRRPTAVIGLRRRMEITNGPWQQRSSDERRANAFNHDGLARACVWAAGSYDVRAHSSAQARPGRGSGQSGRRWRWSLGRLDQGRKERLAATAPPHSGLRSVWRDRRAGARGFRSACERSGLWRYEFAVHRGLCRICLGFRSDGVAQAKLADLY